MFNENKYRKCINHLISIKTDIVVGYMVIIALIGAGLGYPIMKNTNGEWYVMLITAAIGAIIGLIIGLFSTWRVEMKIQEAYWKIDMLNEMRKQSEQKNNMPFAKTVVAIENNQKSDGENSVETKNK